MYSTFFYSCCVTEVLWITDLLLVLPCHSFVLTKHPKTFNRFG